jgi:hypothetical protein
LKKSKAQSPLRLGLLLAALAPAFFTIPDRVYAEAAPPRVSTNPAKFVASFSAMLNSTVDPNGLATSVHFQYGTTTDYGLTTAPQTETGDTHRDIAAHISGLAAETIYHFRIVARNADGTTPTGGRAFTTLTPTGPPVIANSNFRATRIASFSARLNSSIDPHGLATSVHFEYGTTTDYGLTTAPQTETGKAYRDIAADISGLAAHTGYHFRPVASNANGTIFGGDRAFTTLTPTGPPVVTIEPATNVTASGATLHGVVDPHGLTTSATFRLEDSHRATFPQTLTGNGYRDIAAHFGPLAGHKLQACGEVGSKWGQSQVLTHISIECVPWHDDRTVAHRVSGGNPSCA